MHMGTRITLKSFDGELQMVVVFHFVMIVSFPITKIKMDSI